MTCLPFPGFCAAVLLIGVGSGRALAQTPAPHVPRDETQIFFFGNSLIHHWTDSDETTVPHWIAQMAKQGGRSFGADGQWGFPRDFAGELPPSANWRFSEVETVWESYQHSFGAAGFDTIIFNPENYIQYDPVDRPYHGDNPDRATPLGETINVLDWVTENAPGSWSTRVGQICILLRKKFPPTEREMTKYYSHAQTTYARWYDDYVARLAALRPEAEIGIIPVGRVMAEVLTQEPLSQIPTEALYSDLSPYGTETVYLPAAMITYASIYGAPPPTGMELPDTIDAVFVASYDQTAARVRQILNDDIPR